MSKKEDVDWSEEVTLVGIPTMALLPSKNFYFKVHSDKHKITIPRSGNYYDLDKDFFDENSGSFDIVNGDCVNISMITKVLFGSSKYPDLKSNELFCPISIIINKTTVDIFGQVVEMMEAPEGMAVDK